MKHILLSGVFLLTSILSNAQSSFNFGNFIIQKHRVGNVRIGMTLSQADKLIKGLDKQEEEALSFGYDGGSKAVFYYIDDELVFAFIPKLDTDTIMCIIAAHPELKTINGLTASATVGEISKKYTAVYIHFDEMSESEIFYDINNEWDFVFLTEEGERIGKYTEIDKPYKALYFDIPCDWIVVK